METTRCPLTDEWKKKVWCVDAMERYSENRWTAERERSWRRPVDGLHCAPVHGRRPLGSFVCVVPWGDCREEDRCVSCTHPWAQLCLSEEDSSALACRVPVGSCAGFSLWGAGRG